MGYDVRVLIGTTSSMEEENIGKYFSIIAEFDLCVANLALSEIMKGKGAKFLKRADAITLIPIYYYQGDNKITEDCYGDRLVAIEPELLLNELKEKMKKEDYRRFPPLVALLESMLDIWGDKFYVVLYGH